MLLHAFLAAGLLLGHAGSLADGASLPASESGLPRFPPGFIFGSATSAYQVEGGNRNCDWWEWERRRAEREGTAVSGQAADQWNRFREDFALAKKLGHNAHRFSIEWSRIEPKDGEFDRQALEHYRLVLEELHRLGLEPLVTLHHFTNPKWFSDAGGWEREDAPERFERYVDFVLEHLGAQSKIWLPMNEPTVFLAKGWWVGDWPPQKRSLLGLLRAARHVARALRLAYASIKRHNPAAQVGMVMADNAYRPKRAWNPLDDAAARLVRYVANDAIPEGVRGKYDFVGVNYYRTFAISLIPPRIEELGETRSDLGWGIYPEGLRQVLREQARGGKPVWVTENGLADAGDEKRGAFILDHLRQVRRALDEGIDVRAYLHWSLIDNYEWTDGFGPRFGLVAVDYATQRRRVRPSALLLRDIIRLSREPAPR